MPRIVQMQVMDLCDTLLEDSCVPVSLMQLSSVGFENLLNKD